MKTQTKRPFRPPMLNAEGTVADLTATGNTNPENDCFGGSVIQKDMRKGAQNEKALTNEVHPRSRPLTVARDI